MCVCVEDRAAATKIVELVHAEFPHVRTHVRAYDRIHAIELMKRDVAYQIRETFESAVTFGQATLEELGVTPDRAAWACCDRKALLLLKVRPVSWFQPV